MTGQVELAGRYVQRGTLGTGAGTTVYEAFDRLIERRVAVKVVTLPPVDDPETAAAIARFRQGAKAAGGLNHPNIVSVFDYGETVERAWIVMELVDGGSLKNLLDQGERPSLRRIVQIMVQLLEGLGYSHAKGVVHRDIKPANIMLTPAGTVKIADFGIARLENSSMTHVGTMMGTPAYMAPEQLRGETVDQRADIWAAGVVLYQLLTGEKPFGGGITSIMQKALYTEPVPPSRANPNTGSAAFDQVVARAMAKSPAERFASAAEFSDALQQAMASPGPAAPPGAPAAMLQTPTLQAPMLQARDDDTFVRTRPAPEATRQPVRRRLFQAFGAACVIIGLAVGGLAMLRPAEPVPPGMASRTAPAVPPVAPPVPPIAPAPIAPAPKVPALDVPTVGAPPAPPAVAPMPEVPVPRTPVPEIRQVAVVPPPAPVPDPGAVATAIQALPCSLLRVGLSGQTLAVSGLTRATEAAAMRRDIAAAGLPATAARLAVDTFTAPYCDTLDIVRPVVVLGDDAPGFRFTSPNPLRGGQALQFAVSLPAWPARLHIAYVTETGAVGHLVQGGAAYPAGGSATFGDGTRWSATAPFGTDLLLVIASERPLFAQRRRGETLDEFNAALQAALRALPPGDRAAIRVALLHTVPGP